MKALTLLIPRAGLRERMEAPEVFLRRMNRLGILKHGFLGRPMRAKGFARREPALAWWVLTHNLWMLARLRRTRRQPLLAAQTA